MINKKLPPDAIGLVPCRMQMQLLRTRSCGNLCSPRTSRRQEKTMNTYRIATIPGDSIGKEVIPAGQQALKALAASRCTFRCEF